MSKKPITDTAPDDHGVAPIPEANRPGHHAGADPDKPLVPHEALRVAPAPADDEADTKTRFRFDFEPLLVPFAAAVGVIPATSWVDVTEGGDLEVRFGPWVLRTPVDNVAGWELSGDYSFHKVVGPPRLSLADRGVTFATNRRQGLCVRFHDPVKVLDPLGMLRHPGATVTVTSPEQLGAALDKARR
jgi:hypothetical protein